MNSSEKHDKIPEIWEGHNIADYIDPDILQVCVPGDIVCLLTPLQPDPGDMSTASYSTCPQPLFLLRPLGVWALPPGAPCSALCPSTWGWCTLSSTRPPSLSSSAGLRVPPSWRTLTCGHPSHLPNPASPQEWTLCWGCPLPSLTLLFHGPALALVVGPFLTCYFLTYECPQVSLV